jgi:type IV pilus assembly protein PilC
MLTFEYIAQDKTGMTKQGKIKALDVADLTQKLLQQDLILIEHEEIIKKKSYFGIQLFKKVSLVEKMFFTRQLSVMNRAGVPIPRSLELISRQVKNKFFKDIILNIRDEVQKGSMLSDGLAKHEKVFGLIFINMVKVGESDGTLSQSLDNLGNQLKRDYSLISKVKGAMMYPMVILTAMIIIGVLVVYFVLPTLIDTFEEMEAELPFITQLIVDLVNFVNANIVWVLGGIVLLVVGLRYALKKKSVKVYFDMYLLKIPYFGSVAQKFYTARLAGTLGSLLKSGVPITESISISANTLNNIPIMLSLEEVKNGIAGGEKLSALLAKYPNLYPLLLPQLVEIGEETGKMQEVLKEISDFYTEEVENVVKNLSSILEPALMLVVGIVVGFFAVAMFMPMYSLMNTL